MSPRKAAPDTSRDRAVQRPGKSDPAPRPQLDRAQILEPLNPPQREAVAHVDGPLLILAGAGSGKTRVLAHRVAHLVADGVPPYQ
ncbi:MAG: UvrD-helicase domain-containing protein, partial [Candidatus Limnocylindria bacterium]